MSQKKMADWCKVTIELSGKELKDILAIQASFRSEMKNPDYYSWHKRESVSSFISASITNHILLRYDRIERGMKVLKELSHKAS